jgi:RNA polymerase sigma-70 factor (ECF subfamily)
VAGAATGTPLRGSRVVDEALQDTFMAVWRSAGTYSGSGDVGAWIWGIAIRRLIDALRRPFTMHW